MGAIVTGITTYISNRFAERLTIKWQEKSDSNLALLQSQLSKNNTTFDSLVSLLSANYNQGQTRRIQAIDELWKRWLVFKEIIPREGYFIYNVLSEKEIEEYWTKNIGNDLTENLRNKLKNLDEESNAIKPMIAHNDILKERPFLGEKIWYLYYLNSTFAGRISHLIFTGRDINLIHHWHNDGFIKSLFHSYLTTDEITYIYRSKFNSLDNTISFLENKLLQEINKTLSGESLSDHTIEQMKRFNEVVKTNQVGKYDSL